MGRVQPIERKLYIYIPVAADHLMYIPLVIDLGHGLGQKWGWGYPVFRCALRPALKIPDDMTC